MSVTALSQEKIPQVLRVTNDWVQLSEGSVVNIRRATSRDSGQALVPLPDLKHLLDLILGRYDWGYCFLYEKRVLLKIL